MPENPHPSLRDDLAILDDLPRRAGALTERIRRTIVGQHEAVELLLVAAFCHGHVLIEGVPGLAKTLLVRSLASSLGLPFKRIQFTPDMMPGDITGAELIRSDPVTGERTMQFVPGPVFTSILLADEVNRTPPKTQAALLEAMAERTVSIGGITRRLPEPFIVVATQNPIEHEGTYPLPEAQLDRFLLSLRMTYPKVAEERAIVARADEIDAAAAESFPPLFNASELVRLRRIIGKLPIGDHSVEFAVNIARATRPDDEAAPQLVKRYVSWGAGPRTGQALALGAKCLAALAGRPNPGTDDIRRLAPHVLRHRLVLNYAAAAEGITPETIIEAALESATPND